MYIMCCVVDQESTERLCFRTKADADRFRDFVLAYADDSGAGNGYGAYWMWEDEHPYYRPFIPRNAVTALDVGFVETMLRSLMHARTTMNQPMPLHYSCGSRGGGITFTLNTLPPRQRPTTGDMYRIPLSLMPVDLSYDHIPSEGRILADRGDTFTVIGSWDEDPQDGAVRDGARIYEIEAVRVMKINDYLSAMRFPKKVHCS